MGPWRPGVTVAHWLVVLGPGVSGCMVLGVLELMLACWWLKMSFDNWFGDSGGPGASAGALIYETKS